MAKQADEVVQISGRLHLWHFYEPTVKAELFSTAIETTGGILFVDAVPVREELLQQFVAERAIAGIFVTNANHCRATLEFSEKFAAPILAHKAAGLACQFLSAREVKDDDLFVENVRAIEIEGAVPGEMALYYADEGGSIIVGDALINFEPYGFAFLPPKYCTNAKAMRRSLRRLLDCDFDRMLFAHGTPLMHSARKKLEGLLQDSD